MKYQGWDFGYNNFGYDGKEIENPNSRSAEEKEFYNIKDRNPITVVSGTARFHQMNIIIYVHMNGLQKRNVLIKAGGSLVKKNGLHFLFICLSVFIMALPVHATTGEAFFSSTQKDQRYINVKLSRTKLSMYITERKTLNVTVTGSQKTPIWKSNNTAIATVNSKGTISAKKAGTATITVIVDGVKKSCKVTVKENWYRKVLDLKTETYVVKNFINNQNYKVYRKNFKYYCVTDINNDGVKELILYTHPEMVLFTYYKGKVTPLMYNNTNRGVRLKNNYFTIVTGTSSENICCTYRLIGNKMKEVINYFHTTSSAHPVPIYEINGKKCSKDAFDRVYNKYYINGRRVLDLCTKI